MRTLQLLTLTAFLAISYQSFSQSSTELFKKVKEYYNQHAKSAKSSSLDYNRAEKMLNSGDANIPIKDVKILYVEIQGSHIVTFNCQGCILSLDENNRTEYLNGIGIEFNSKDECYEFIDLLADFREKI